MKALILRSDVQAAVATSRALIDKGFQILCVESQEVAHALIRIDTIDLLIMDERVQGQLTHAIALSGERRNPYLSAILLTDRDGAETDDLYSLIPTLYALAGHDTPPDMLTRLAMSAVSGFDAIAARVAEVAQTEQVEEELTLDAEEPPQADEPAEHDVLVLDQAFAVPQMTDAVVAEIHAVASALPPPAAEPRPLERVEDIVLREVAALFDNQVVPYARSRPIPVRPPLIQAR